VTRETKGKGKCSGSERNEKEPEDVNHQKLTIISIKSARKGSSKRNEQNAVKRSIKREGIKNIRALWADYPTQTWNANRKPGAVQQG